jgi:MFS family permease
MPLVDPLCGDLTQEDDLKLSGELILKRRRGIGSLRGQYSILVASNTLTALGSAMQQLLQGWLAVAWGHSVLFLAVFAVFRILPKVVLTIPAGIICDRVPRVHVLLACRGMNVLASLLPLAGLVLPERIVWLLLAICLGGALHAFDLPAGRAVLGDVTEKEDLSSVISLSHGGAHLAALIGPPLAYLLGPPGLLASAGFFFLASLLIVGLRSQPVIRSVPFQGSRTALSEFLKFTLRTPATSTLIVLGILPGLVDKGVPLLVPSVSSGGVTSAALVAPELGAIIAAVTLSLLSVRLNLSAIRLAILGYALLLGMAFRFSYEPELLIAGLFAAGVTKLAFNTASQTQIQASVPPELRGRALTF